MALTSDLMGVGMPDSQARRIGSPPQMAVTAAGSTSATATVLSAQNKVVNMTATGADGIRLPATTPLNTPFLVFNSSGSTGIVYPPTGASWNGGSTDAGLSMTTKKTAVFMMLSLTVGIYILTA